MTVFELTLSARRLVAVTAVVFVCFAYPAAASSDSVTYTYYPNGRLWTINYANGTVITYIYDTAGNRQQVTVTCSSGGC